MWTLGCMFLFELSVCLSRYMPRDRTARSYGSSGFSVWEPFSCPPERLHPYTLLPAVWGFPTSSPVFSVCLSHFKTLAFVSRSLVITLLGMDLGKFSWCVLTWNLFFLTWNLLGVWPVDLCLLSNGKFSPSISVNSSQPFSFFPQWYEFRSFDVDPQVLQSLCIWFFTSIFALFRELNFYCF